MRFLPHTPTDRSQMMDAIGIREISELLHPIPEKIRLEGPLELPAGLSETELVSHMKDLADKNSGTEEMPCFMGGGAYDHFIPAAVDHLISRSEFYTAYTPYQAELSQGTLQSMYEYQTMICELTGMDVANASLYEGGSAVAEAAVMAIDQKRKEEVVVLSTVHPEYRAVLSTYAESTGFNVLTVPEKGDTRINPDDVDHMISEDTAAVIIQYPNFFGALEELDTIGRLASENGVTLIAVTNPIALAVLRPPSEFGAEIAVGEGQSLGNPLNFGGPYLGFMAACENYLRRVPGRLSGATADSEGQRGFVLALQAREQHIRRERASSNICTNEALNALAATIYMALMGPEGLAEVAEQSMLKAHYTAEVIAEIPSIEVLTAQPFFHEFVISLPRAASEVNRRLHEDGIIGGLDLGRFRREWKNRMLICVTEKRSREEIELFTELLGGILNE